MVLARDTTPSCAGKVERRLAEALRDGTLSEAEINDALSVPGGESSS